MTNKDKVSFLFGAGAEGRDNFNLVNGYEYLKKSLFYEKYHPKMLDALKDYFDGNYFNGYKYRKDTLKLNKILLSNMAKQKAETNREFFMNYEHYLYVFLPKNDYDDLKDLYSDSNESNKVAEHIKRIEEIKKKDIESEFEQIIREEISKYNKINSGFLRELFYDNGGNITYELPLSVAGVLDAYFYTITNPVKHGVIKFSRVFNYYWACYFTILNDVMRCCLDEQELKQYVTDSGELNYKKILCDLHSLTKTLYNRKIPYRGNSYYAHIINKISQYSNRIACNAVVTTNYYRFASQITENIIYLNGQLKLFEYPELLEVSDFCDSNILNERLFFPFIFGQSYVKPVIHDAQIQIFSAFKNCLDTTDVLVILGFNVNEDDNHINSYLHEFVKKGKRLLIVCEPGNSNAVHERLKCKATDIELCEVQYGDNERVIDTVFEKILNP